MEKTLKVCLVCEGSYPYVSGGVASWIHMLCTEYEDLDFIIWSIATTNEDMHAYKYEIPSNVKKIETIYIGEPYHEIKAKKVSLPEKDCEILRMLITAPSDHINWSDVVHFIASHRKNLMHVILGVDFYECCLSIYQEKEMVSVFRDFLWNMRGMYLPLMRTLTGDIPEADLYHSVSTGYAGILASCASYIYKKPFILSEHGIYTREREEDIIRSNWVEGEYKDLWIDFFKKLSAISYYRADIITSLFEKNKTLQIELGCPEEKIQVIPNGVDFQKFKREVPVVPEKKETFDIGAILRIVSIKDVKTMLVSFYQVKKNMKNARLHILGNYDEDPNYYQECLTLIESLGLQDVIFYGQVNVQEYIDLFDVLLLTSISEGQPLAVLEGMSAGKPFVCTNVGNCKELIYGDQDSYGPAGYIVPVMNGDEIAQAIAKLYNDPEGRLQMGRNGQERVKNKYQKQNFLKEFRNLYEEIGEEKDGRYRV